MWVRERGSRGEGESVRHRCRDRRGHTCLRLKGPWDRREGGPLRTVDVGASAEPWLSRTPAPEITLSPLPPSHCRMVWEALSLWRDQKKTRETRKRGKMGVEGGKIKDPHRGKKKKGVCQFNKSGLPLAATNHSILADSITYESWKNQRPRVRNDTATWRHWWQGPGAFLKSLFLGGGSSDWEGLRLWEWPLVSHSLKQRKDPWRAQETQSLRKRNGWSTGRINKIQPRGSLKGAREGWLSFTHFSGAPFLYWGMASSTTTVHPGATWEGFSTLTYPQCF